MRLTPLILCLTTTLLFTGCAPDTPTPAPYASLHDSTTGDLPPIDATTSLLVVSPHPDDETLCCAGVIQRVLAAGGRVTVVWITNGDGSRLSMLLIEKSLLASREKAQDLANRRMQEARAATRLLGIPATGQFFLGYPDGGLPQLLTSNRLQHDFAAVLDRVQPTLVLAPSLADTHPDHKATGQLATVALKDRGALTKLHYWIVHGGEGWPSPQGLMTGIPLNMPTTAGNPPNWPLALADNEVARKEQAINAYQTQMEVMAPFLLSFARTTELFSSP